MTKEEREIALGVRPHPDSLEAAAANYRVAVASFVNAFVSTIPILRRYIKQ